MIDLAIEMAFVACKAVQTRVEDGEGNMDIATGLDIAQFSTTLLIRDMLCVTEYFQARN